MLVDDMPDDFVRRHCDLDCRAGGSVLGIFFKFNLENDGDAEGGGGAMPGRDVNFFHAGGLALLSISRNIIG